MTRVLVVEDDSQLLKALSISLRARTYEVDTAPDGATALRLAAVRPPDAVLLDLGLPDLDGLDVIKGLRGRSGIPILVVSARRAEAEKIEALDTGADDYITKPFGMEELLARLRVALRNKAPAPPGNDARLVIRTEDFTVDLTAKKATSGGQDIRLTPTEWHLLELLLRNPGRLISQQQMLQEVWGPAYGDHTNYLRVYMAQLRRKLESDPSRPRHLITEPGMGYRFEE
ncbi:response regulator [Streptomyces sp. TRM68367]|uniref:response regulator n=1 Tax=Streptomyces sp. TRM68367 TaxID=2758415 RepID=UPI00165C59ED|nr:response regulator [Streptomyces sp. TRM68367]MBC9729204.1 response regulator [Streptomyces sp. TRM68367]